MLQKKRLDVYNYVDKFDYTPVKSIVKVSTFERNGIIVTTCVDYNTGFTRPAKGRAPFRFKKVQTFIKTNHCKTIHYYHEGEYRYTCRTWSPSYKYDDITNKNF